MLTRPWRAYNSPTTAELALGEQSLRAEHAAPQRVALHCDM
jgi:hypothetical protein